MYGTEYILSMWTSEIYEVKGWESDTFDGILSPLQLLPHARSVTMQFDTTGQNVSKFRQITESVSVDKKSCLYLTI